MSGPVAGDVRRDGDGCLLSARDVRKVGEVELVRVEGGVAGGVGEGQGVVGGVAERGRRRAVRDGLVAGGVLVAEAAGGRVVPAPSATSCAGRRTRCRWRS